MTHLHILGICGTFMGGIALLARALGYSVSGSDTGVYPPMSTQLAAAGIELLPGYQPEHLQPAPDLVIVGNALSRGNPAVEYMLRTGLRYTSGPQWLAEHYLHNTRVLAVAGTHGKTTCSSMLAWILEQAGLKPGFLIGGIPKNFGVSARPGAGRLFVVEADEYDTAFFDKRSKFVHYRPHTLVLNNLEFDHADIFPDLAAIQRQCHHLVRTVPDNGLIIAPADDANIAEVLAQGCWSPQQSFAETTPADWQVQDASPDGQSFTVCYQQQPVGQISWPCTGRHNIRNALAALAAAQHVGVDPAQGTAALCDFAQVQRRMELCGTVRGVRILDDFAHHPTAIRLTLQGLRAQVGDQRIIAVLDPGSNSMRRGAHVEQLADALSAADQVHLFAPADLTWSPDRVLSRLGQALQIHTTTDSIVRQIAAIAQPEDAILVMSNRGFEQMPTRLVRALSD
ncbi:MAG: UDP-N-acetylmuramate:L-alanyl-gamma-D-glutamyl-meso-diaminopimelate ligase [Pseudomonadota bacterium]